MVDTLPVSPQPPSPQPASQATVLPRPQVTPPSAPTAPVSAPEGSDLAERSDPLSMEYAGFGARFLASLVDGIIVVIIDFVFMIPALIIMGGVISAAKGISEPSATMLVLQLLLQGIGLIAVVVYYIYFTAKGQTLGKKALKLRVVRVENGETPGYTKAFLREVVGKMVSAMVFGLGYLWILWDGKKQTWHDKIAGTVVVKA